MQTVHERCAGLDVHKDTVVACVRRPDRRPEVRTFGTTTAALLGLLDWLAASGVTAVAVESTGVYWKPVFNLFDGHVPVVLVNAEHVKKVPGRKTDASDAEWLARLVGHGLLTASFVPPRPIRELRELTRRRTQLVRERAAVANRVQKVLEDCNVKLGSVAADVFGKSGREMLDRIAAGETDAGKLAESARGRMRAKLPELREALAGRVTDHHRFVLRLHPDHADHLDGLIGRIGAEIDRLIAADRPAEGPPAAGGPAPLAEAKELLATVPGVGGRTAEVILAEVGPDMRQFPTAPQLASWAGVCPGNHESAGKRKGGRNRGGSRWLEGALIQAAWAAGRTKGTYLGALFRRQSKRLGAKKAVLAVAHALLGVVYQVLRKREPYKDLGADYFDRQEPERLTRKLVRRLEELGHKVTLQPQAAGA